MSRHFIIMSSSYLDGARIALDFAGEKKLKCDKAKRVLSDIQTACGEDVPLSMHFIMTDSDDWDSVKHADPFFDDVVCVKSVSKFCEKIQKSRVLSGRDVALYILTKAKCTRLSLEKLVYFAYADYLCDYSESLFDDEIYALAHGPVVEGVCALYKKSDYLYTLPAKLDEDKSVSTDLEEMPAMSRILFAKSGGKKLSSIDSTIQKYGEYSARELVDMTHRKGSPWSRTDSTQPHQIIDDKLIKQYHYIEAAC